MADLLYQLNQVRHYYGDKKVLDIDRLSVPRGSILGISGANGSGKSTLLKLLAFSMAPGAGEIRFNGRAEFPMSPRVRSRVTLLTQTPYLLKRSVLDNVAYGLKIRKEKTGIRERAAAALTAVGLSFDEFSSRMWHELSGGEAQRVAMAARLILRPDALLLDEPVASVDTRSAALIQKASLAARDEWGCTLVVVSHDLSWLHEVSDTRVSMANGKIFSAGAECIIPGPYAKDDQGRIIKVLEGGRHLRLTNAPLLPETENRTAVIPQKKISLYPAREQRDDTTNQIPATVTHMLLEKKTGHILTTMDMNGFSLTLSITPSQISQLNLCPGNSAVLVFSPDDIFWR